VRALGPEPGGIAAIPLEARDSEVWDWIALLKPRVMGLVVYTAAIGLFIAPAHMHPVLAFTAILSIAIGGGAAGALNMWWERETDGLMRRTASRPLPAGRIDPDAALGFGIILAAASVLLMGLAANWLAAGALAASILFYVLVYTAWLKPRTPQNIVIGGAAGAFPPAIGWAAATGSFDAMPLVLFAIVFLWTPPHFWALSLWARGDYARAGIPMLPVVAGAKETRRQILIYSVVLVAASLLPCLFGAGRVYGVVTGLLGARFLWLAWRVTRDAQDAGGESLTGDAPAKALFGWSILYLFALFAALLADHLLR